MRIPGLLIVPSWLSFYDVDEIVPELAWPNSVEVYGATRNDAQVDALFPPLFSRSLATADTSTPTVLVMR